MSDVTRILDRVEQGDRKAAEELLPLVYDELRRLYVAGSTVTDVDGFPRSLARLLDNPAERDFRVLTPAEFSRSSGAARVRVLRTGPTTNAASVSFSTSDDTAKAGEDYLPQSGILNFSPLEVSKEITVPLVARKGTNTRLWFKLDLSNPSAGYAIPSTPVGIRPDFGLTTESSRLSNRSISITLQGTLPGITYALESSTNLTDWARLIGARATSTTQAFDIAVPSGPRQFFRARRE